jgi:serine/threonine protein kinase
LDKAVADVGTVIGARYRIEGVLGEGGMAIVYKARHTSTGKTCALKLVHRHLVSRPELVELFVREAQIAGRIGEHPNIVNVFDAGVDDTWKIPFIAMELLNGQTLEQYVSQYGPLPHDIFRKVFEQLADALEQAHRAGVVHRDLKPSNLILTYDRKAQPVLKVMDFGIAKILEQESHRTATHIGSPAYAAPEQQSGAAMRRIAAGQGIVIATGVSAATDVWAVGLVAYELLTGLSAGHFWSHAESLNDLLLKIALDTPPPASIRAGERASLLPRGFDQWFERCLHKNAAARWQSVGEAVGQLLRLPFQSPAAMSSTLRMDHAPLPASPNPAPPNAPPAHQPSQGELLRLPPIGVPHAIDTTPSSDDPTRVVARPIRQGGEPPAPGAALNRAPEGMAARLSPAPAPRQPVLTPPPVSSEAPTRVMDRRSLELEPPDAGPAKQWDPQLSRRGGRWTSAATVFGRHRTVAVTAGASVVALAVFLMALGLMSSDTDSNNTGDASTGAPSTTASSTGKDLPAEAAPPSSAGAPAANSVGSPPAPPLASSRADQIGPPESAGDGSTSKAKPAQQAPWSKLRVNSKHGFCRVTINGAIKGYTPMEVDVPAGAYDVGCNTVGWKATRRVKVSAGKISYVTFEVAR